MDPRDRQELEQARHHEAARYHRRLAERLGSAGYHDLAAVHLLEAKLAELNAAAARERSARPWLHAEDAVHP